ncbi:MAG: thioredoxin family protein [Candidatus Micrarchaeota archaeon]|nr:thioredoxin family protein [Candidatus Micrarchaeota archaeon]
MKIYILGMGCPSCKRLEENVKKAVAELKLKAIVAKVTEIEKIMEYGVTSSPALVIDNEVVLMGRVPNVNELKEILGDYI